MFPVCAVDTLHVFLTNVCMAFCGCLASSLLQLLFKLWTMKSFVAAFSWQDVREKARCNWIDTDFHSEACLCCWIVAFLASEVRWCWIVCLLESRRWPLTRLCLEYTTAEIHICHEMWQVRLTERLMSNVLFRKVMRITWVILGLGN